MSQVSRRIFTLGLLRDVVVVGIESVGAQAAGSSSRSDRPVWRRKTSSRLGRARVSDWARSPAPSRTRMRLRDGDVALVDVEADEVVLRRRLADERLGADRFEHVLDGAVDADRDDVAGHLALQLVGRALGDDPRRGR